ncbi:hypothetical protein [Longimicrobium sp.]|uniref:hypothetical protein n=1 Tax=Longimicrobium sp. TaxID=2029185 RepID=UPI002E306DC6|nr:hypothetical protein [Longimicrobium sp.]HEX6037660.1 hypothetical protein [Longimicrobium sp.]
MASPVIINQAGPLPIKTTIEWPSTNTVIVAVSGSAFAQKPATMLGVNVSIKDAWNTIQVFANQAGTHMAFPTGFFPVNGAFGEITLTLSAVDGNTMTDANDHFTVALIY